jgi:hypothetical protein
MTMHQWAKLPTPDVHDDRVARPGVAEQLVQVAAVEGSTGFLIGAGVLGGRPAAEPPTVR